MVQVRLGECGKRVQRSTVVRHQLVGFLRTDERWLELLVQCQGTEGPVWVRHSDLPGEAEPRLREFMLRLRE